MRTPILIATLLSASLSLVAADAPGPLPQVPRKSPELVIQSPGKQLLLSQLRGKVCAIAFVSTECSHCQHLGAVFMPLQQEYGPKGVQFLMVAFNPEANFNLPQFTQMYARNFPVGISSDATVLTYLQHPRVMHYFPNIVFVDRQGVIRSEYLGNPSLDPSNFFEEKNEVRNIRTEIDKLLASPSPAVHSDAKKTAAKK